MCSAHAGGFSVFRGSLSELSSCETEAVLKTAVGEAICGVFNGGPPSQHTFQLLQSDFEDLVTILRHLHMGWSWFSLLAS